MATRRPPAAASRPGFRPDGTPLSGTETIAAVRAETDTVLLSFSCGKDSIAAWLAVRDVFPNIVPFYLYLVPDLAFVDESLDYYEQWFGTRIIRVPHPTFYGQMNTFVMQAPENCAVIEAARLPLFTFDDVSRLLIEDYDLPASTFTLTGIRAADSPNRRSAINQHGPINWNRRYAYPVWDLLKADMVELLYSSGIHLPIDYQWFGRSFDGIDYRFLSVIKREAPADYARILAWFPLADLELFRYEQLEASR